MKKIIAILAILAVTIPAFSQSQINTDYGTIYNNSFVAKSADTLKGVDTTYIYFSASVPYWLHFDLTTVQKADSLSGTAVLQARDDQNGTGWLTYGSAYWNSITGVTSVCTTCIGATKTYTVATGTTVSTWDVGKGNFQYWRLRIVGTRSTDTTAVTGQMRYGY